MKAIGPFLTLSTALLGVGNSFTAPQTRLVFALTPFSPSSSLPPQSLQSSCSFSPSSSTSLYLAKSKNYSKEVRLREEAEAPFRKVRFFVYSALLAGCFVSLLVSAARIAAGLNGINVDLLQESLNNAAIDTGGIALLGFLLKNDLDAQESRLQRASKGGELASLPVRGKALFFYEDNDEKKANKVLTLSSFRAGRGIDKRVVILVSGEKKISQLVSELKSNSMQESLVQSDLFVIPVIIPNCVAPLDVDEELLKEECIGLPVQGATWRNFLDDEIAEATKQGVDVESEGFALILKKNGRVGQRTSGFNLSRMVGEVEDRQESGLDVTNI